jgi:hypothetical protein
MKFFIVIFLLLTTFASYAQNMVIAARVTDEVNLPVRGAFVVDKVSGTHAITKRNGIVYLLVSKQPSTLLFSCGQYDSLSKKITALDLELLKADTLYLNILLKEKINVLNEVDIRPDEFTLAYNNPAASIIDYEFENNRLVLLVKEKLNPDGQTDQENYRLRVVNDSTGKTTDFKLWERPVGLEHDCYNRLLVEFPQYYYQFTVDNKGIKLRDKVTVEQYNYYLSTCACARGNKLFYRQFGLHNQSVIYYLIDKKTKSESLLLTISDKESEHFAESSGKQINVLKGYGLNKKDNKLAVNINVVDEIESRQKLYEKAVSVPVYHPLFRIGNNQLIFDHVHDSAYVFNDDGKKQRVFAIHYNTEPGFANELIPGDEANCIYARVLRNGTTWLIRVDLTNGNSSGEYRLHAQGKPVSIKVKNNTIYYLYAPTGANGVLYLFKQKME